MNRLVLLLICFLSIKSPIAKAQLFSLGNDTTICNGTQITISPQLSVVTFPDSLVITYNATLGVTSLPGANKVYMHAGVQFVPFGPVSNWIGNWGIDDSLGLMTEIATDVWQITIQPQNYFNLTSGTTIYGIFCVFRNEDGTLTGKDNSNNDIFLNLSNPIPSSSFNGIGGTWIKDLIESYSWNTGQTSSQINAVSTGNYVLTVTDTAGSIYQDSLYLTVVSPSLNLGPNRNICNNNPITLHAGPAFDTYLWNNTSTDSVLQVNMPGQYSLIVSLLGCFAYDTVQVNSISTTAAPVSLGNDTSVCGALSVVLSPGITLSDNGDSLTIVYDATQGVTQLVGVSKVYMHAGVQFVPFGPVSNWVGNWGQDDGIGLMDSLGNNLWRITINVQNYFGTAPGAQINALSIVFRNPDGTLTGKDNSNNDIFLLLNALPPSSGFGGITGTWYNNPYESALWSDGSTGDTYTANSAGAVWLQVTTTEGCVFADTVVVNTGNIPFVDVGSSQNLCQGDSLVLSTPLSFVSYLWNTGDTGSSIIVDTAGTYTITVTNADGCTGIDVVNIAQIQEPVASFTYTPSGSGVVQFSANSNNVTTYAWDLNGDGINDASVQNTFYTYLSPGLYSVRLIVSNNCGQDTLILSVNPFTSDFSYSVQEIKAFPNPANEFVNLTIPRLAAGFNMQVSDITGCNVNVPFSSLTDKIILNTSQLPSGLYFIKTISGNSIYHSKIIVKHQ